MLVEKLNSNHDEPEVRNSPVRKLTAEIVQSVTEKLHRRFPNLSPTHLNILGTIGVACGSWLAIRENRKRYKNPTLPLSILATSSLMDAFDGSLARTIAKEDPRKVDFFKGQLLDAGNDRVQELAMGLSRVASAHERKDGFGETVAYLATVTNSMPSLSRSLMESTGKVVPEAGNGVIGFFGTRVGRAVVGIAATVFPEVKRVPIQSSLDAMTIVANTVTTASRLRRLKDADNLSPKLSPEKQKEAIARAQMLGVLTGITFGVVLFTYHQLRQKK